MGATTFVDNATDYVSVHLKTLLWKKLSKQHLRMRPSTLSGHTVKAHQIDKNSESKLHGVEIEELPVIYNHPLSCPVYVLDHRLHSAGGAGPPKWDPCSRIGVYCGHSPFHAGNVALSSSTPTQAL